MVVVALAEKITNWCDDETLTDNDRQVVQYGLELLIENMIKIAIFLVAGIIIGQFIETAITIASFSVLRVQAGGIHAKTNIGCTMCTGGVIAFSLYISKVYIMPKSIWILLCAASMIICLALAPNGSRIYSMMKATDKKHKKYMALAICCLYFSISINIHIRCLVVMPMFIESLTVLLCGGRKTKWEIIKR